MCDYHEKVVMKVVNYCCDYHRMVVGMVGKKGLYKDIYYHVSSTLTLVPYI